MHVHWDESASATAHGQLVFFAEILAATGVFERWVSSCPLEYRSGNAPDKRDVLGMNKIVREDALRRALQRIDEAASTPVCTPRVLSMGCPFKRDFQRLSKLSQPMSYWGIHLHL